MLKLSLHLQILTEQIHYHCLHVASNTTPVPVETDRSNPVLKLDLRQTGSGLSNRKGKLGKNERKKKGKEIIRDHP